jgi:hypothetical protein
VLAPQVAVLPPPLLPLQSLLLPQVVVLPLLPLVPLVVLVVPRLLLLQAPASLAPRQLLPLPTVAATSRVEQWNDGRR